MPDHTAKVMEQLHLILWVIVSFYHVNGQCQSFNNEFGPTGWHRCRVKGLSMICSRLQKWSNKRTYTLSGVECNFLKLYGSHLPGGIFLQKLVIFFLSLRAYCGQVCDAGGLTFLIIILLLEWRPQKYKSFNDDTLLWPSGGPGA